MDIVLQEELLNAPKVFPAQLTKFARVEGYICMLLFPDWGLAKRIPA